MLPELSKANRTGKSKLRMTTRLAEWIKRANTTPETLTGFLESMGINPQDVRVGEERHILGLERATGVTQKNSWPTRHNAK